MNFILYLETKICDILFHIVFTGVGVLLLAAAGFQNGYLILAAAFSVCACLIFHWLRYRHQAARQTRIMDLTDSLEETWYAAEVLPSPREPESRAYHYALKRACKAMNERLEKSVEEQQDYREYIERSARSHWHLTT